MGVFDKIMVGLVFAKKPELSRAEFNQRLGRFYIKSEQTKEISQALAQEGLIKIVKRNNQPFFQRPD